MQKQRANASHVAQCRSGSCCYQPVYRRGTETVSVTRVDSDVSPAAQVYFFKISQSMPRQVHGVQFCDVSSKSSEEVGHGSVLCTWKDRKCMQGFDMNLFVAEQPDRCRVAWRVWDSVTEHFRSIAWERVELTKKATGTDLELRTSFRDCSHLAKTCKERTNKHTESQHL